MQKINGKLVQQQLSVNVTKSHYYPSIILASKGGALPSGSKKTYGWLLFLTAYYAGSDR
jgi:hypothetical protein